ncbi:DUF742 domain-containing protein [Streptomyces sp. S3(2020)]|uniref:DUF742 domain-containing protein n=1 Tax=Streptomyces sp. S3(2020) TaxID=2732044 RepID=UPI0014887B55|nr:DUF742 domain-containing protein [Streptomyces sp. S3(2020)]NNN32197.1 DUF742 domain-containing protein [Streptomyces sp. S3(2020)]
MTPALRRLSVAADPDTTAFVRPYALTRGRTQPRYRLRLESVMHPGPGRPGPGLPEECGRITALCRTRPRSVAELAGTLGCGLTPAKILISDLMATHVLVPGAADAASDPDHTLLLRLRAALAMKWPDE